MLILQALEKADKAKNTADKSAAIISTTTNTLDAILGQIGEYHNELLLDNTRLTEGNIIALLIV